MNDRVKGVLDRVRDTADFGYVTFDDLNATNALGDNALHGVCVWGDIEAARVLIEAGININQKGEHGFTPLAVAETFGHAGVAELLRSLGAIRAGSLDSPSDPDSRAAHLRRLDEVITTLQTEIDEKCSGEIPNNRLQQTKPAPSD
ncbi:MAG TPA: ankyrin repeat domain-containing protein [Vicinamibacterales bacterium]|nr:ankyrin repeat domain-containing protein [Vicinamibacterales bacterium]